MRTEAWSPELAWRRAGWLPGLRFWPTVLLSELEAAFAAMAPRQRGLRLGPRN